MGKRIICKHCPCRAHCPRTLLLPCHIPGAPYAVEAARPRQTWLPSHRNNLEPALRGQNSNVNVHMIRMEWVFRQQAQAQAQPSICCPIPFAGVDTARNQAHKKPTPSKRCCSSETAQGWLWALLLIWPACCCSRPV